MQDGKPCNGTMQEVPIRGQSDCYMVVGLCGFKVGGFGFRVGGFGVRVLIVSQK